MVPSAQRHKRPLCAARGLGDNVDDSVDCVSAPQRPARTADHFDAINVFQHDILLVPEHARKERGVDSAPVDQDKELVADGIVEAACADRILAGIKASDLQVGC
ncbi:hypothetical protein D3C71_1507260 [compost metagenome]